LLEAARAHIIPPLDDPEIAIKPTQQRVQDKVTQLLTPTTPRRSIQLCQHTEGNVQVQNTRMMSQEAINNLLMDDLHHDLTCFTPDNLWPMATPDIDFEHLAMPMVHPVTGETISSYKKLKNDLATAETWMIAFGKEFGGMAQGDNKTGQKGTN
jgi:hypothetical protein